MGALFQADSSGLARYLQKDPALAAALQHTAAKVAADAQAATSMPVETEQRVTDRAVVDVTITHPGGASAQAKHGVLTRAASAQGLEVRPPKRGRR